MPTACLQYQKKVLKKNQEHLKHYSVSDFKNQFVKQNKVNT